MNKELALESRIKEPVSLGNLRDVIREAIEAGGYLTKEKLEEDTECVYNFRFDANTRMIAWAGLLGLQDKLYAQVNGMLMLPNIKRKDCEIVSDSSGYIWEILLHKLDNGLWVARTYSLDSIFERNLRLSPGISKIYPSKEAALRYEAQDLLDYRLKDKNLRAPEYAPYADKAIKEAERLGGVK